MLKKHLSSKEDNYLLSTTNHANDQPASSCIYVLTVLALILKQNVQPKHMTMEKIMSKGRTRNHKRSLRKVINVCKKDIYHHVSISHDRSLLYFAVYILYFIGNCWLRVMFSHAGVYSIPEWLIVYQSDILSGRCKFVRLVYIVPEWYFVRLVYIVYQSDL